MPPACWCRQHAKLAQVRLRVFLLLAPGFMRLTSCVHFDEVVTFIQQRVVGTSSTRKAQHRPFIGIGWQRMVDASSDGDGVAAMNHPLGR